MIDAEREQLYKELNWCDQAAHWRMVRMVAAERVIAVAEDWYGAVMDRVVALATGGNPDHEAEVDAERRLCGRISDWLERHGVPDGSTRTMLYAALKRPDLKVPWEADDTAYRIKSTAEDACFTAYRVWQGEAVAVSCIQTIWPDGTEYRTPWRVIPNPYKAIPATPPRQLWAL